MRPETKVLEVNVKPGWKGTKLTFHNEGNVYPGQEPPALTAQPALALDHVKAGYVLLRFLEPGCLVLGEVL